MSDDDTKDITDYFKDVPGDILMRLADHITKIDGDRDPTATSNLTVDFTLEIADLFRNMTPVLLLAKELNAMLIERMAEEEKIIQAYKNKMN